MVAVPAYHSGARMDESLYPGVHVLVPSVLTYVYGRLVLNPMHTLVVAFSSLGAVAAAITAWIYHEAIIKFAGNLWRHILPGATQRAADDHLQAVAVQQTARAAIMQAEASMIEKITNATTVLLEPMQKRINDLQQLCDNQATEIANMNTQYRAKISSLERRVQQCEEQHARLKEATKNYRPAGDI